MSALLASRDPRRRVCPDYVCPLRALPRSISRRFCSGGSSVSQPRVALAGFYGLGNYGDDLMAHICAVHLAEHGIPCTLFSLGEGDRDSLATPEFLRAGLRSTNDARALVQGADILVWGGGGLLVSWKERVYRRRFPGVAEKFDRLVRLARDQGLVRCAISVGGNDGTDTALSPDYKRLFLDGARYVSVRNPSDLGLLRALGIDGDCFPDLVWRAGNREPVRRRSAGPMRIGLDIYFSNLGDQKALHFGLLLQALAWKCPDVTFVCLNSTRRAAGSSMGFHRWIRGKNVEHYQFHDFDRDASMLAGLDLLVSSRLHVPMVCLGHGVPVVWTFCEQKTRLFLQTIGLSEMNYGHGRMAEFVRMISTPEQLASFLARYPFPDTESLFRASGGHLQKLVEVVRSTRTDSASAGRDLDPQPAS